MYFIFSLFSEPQLPSKDVTEREYEYYSTLSHPLKPSSQMTQLAPFP